MIYPKIDGIKNLQEKFINRKFITENGLTPNQLISVLKLKTNTVTPDRSELVNILSKDEPIIKFGIDPTGSEIHLGHAMSINIARLIQSTGKDITLVIGDFTAKIGDPTGRNTERKVISDEIIQKNYESYKAQAGKIIDMDKTNVVFNSNMLSDISISELTKFFQKVSLGGILQREDFKNRIKGGHGLSLAEICYPLFMALDSIKLKADLEIGGKDQLLNFLITRELMKKEGLKPEMFITTDLLPGINGNGEKMSKSLGNYIGLLESGTEVYGKIMSIPDNLVELYVFSLIDIDISEKNEFKKLISDNPYEFKKALAYYMSSLISGKNDADLAIEEWARKFSKKDVNEEDFILYEIEKSSLLEALVDNKIVESKSQCRRLFSSGAIKEVNSNKFNKIFDPDFEIGSEIYIKVGKKRFVKFVTSKNG